MLNPRRPSRVPETRSVRAQRQESLGIGHEVAQAPFGSFRRAAHSFFYRGTPT